MSEPINRSIAIDALNAEIQMHARAMDMLIKAVELLEEELVKENQTTDSDDAKSSSPNAGLDSVLDDSINVIVDTWPKLTDDQKNYVFSNFEFIARHLKS